MALPRFARTTVTVARPSMVDDHGSQVPDWSSTVDHDVTGCSVQPGPGRDVLERRDGVEIAMMAYLPPEADVVATDALRLSGQLYKIVGDPRHWTSPSGALDHIEVQLQRWVG